MDFTKTLYTKTESVARLTGDDRRVGESYVDIKGKCTLPFGLRLQLKLE